MKIHNFLSIQRRLKWHRKKDEVTFHALHLSRLFIWCPLWRCWSVWWYSPRGIISSDTLMEFIRTPTIWRRTMWRNHFNMLYIKWNFNCYRAKVMENKRKFIISYGIVCLPNAFPFHISTIAWHIRNFFLTFWFEWKLFGNWTINMLDININNSSSPHPTSPPYHKNFFPPLPRSLYRPHSLTLSPSLSLHIFSLQISTVALLHDLQDNNRNWSALHRKILFSFHMEARTLRNIFGIGAIYQIFLGCSFARSLNCRKNVRNYFISFSRRRRFVRKCRQQTENLQMHLIERKMLQFFCAAFERYQQERVRQSVRAIFFVFFFSVLSRSTRLKYWFIHFCIALLLLVCWYGIGKSDGQVCHFADPFLFFRVHRKNNNDFGGTIF